MPPRLSRRKGQLPEVLEALRPVKWKIDELVAVGLGKNIPSTVTKCDAGWIAVKAEGFVISAKKITEENQRTSADFLFFLCVFLAYTYQQNKIMFTPCVKDDPIKHKDNRPLASRINDILVLYDLFQHHFYFLYQE